MRKIVSTLCLAALLLGALASCQSYTSLATRKTNMLKEHIASAYDPAFGYVYGSFQTRYSTAGRDGGGMILLSLERRDPEKQTWQELFPIPLVRSSSLSTSGVVSHVLTGKGLSPESLRAWSRSVGVYQIEPGEYRIVKMYPGDLRKTVDIPDAELHDVFTVQAGEVHYLGYCSASDGSLTKSKTLEYGSRQFSFIEVDTEILKTFVPNVDTTRIISHKK